MAAPDWHPAMTKMPVPIVHLDIHCSEPGYYVAADNEAQGRIIAEPVSYTHLDVYKRQIHQQHQQRHCDKPSIWL